MSCCNNDPFKICSFNFSRGDEFDLVLKYTINGAVVDLTNLEFVAKLYDSSDVLVQDLLVQKTDQTAQPGFIVCSATPEQTALWPIDSLTCAIIETNGSAKNSFPIFSVNVGC